MFVVRDGIHKMLFTEKLLSGMLQYKASTGTNKHTIHVFTPDRWQSKTLISPTNVDKNVRNRVFDCHLSPDWRQMPIENTVSSNI